MPVAIASVLWALVAGTGPGNFPPLDAAVERGWTTSFRQFGTRECYLAVRERALFLRSNNRCSVNDDCVVEPLARRFPPLVEEFSECVPTTTQRNSQEKLGETSSREKVVRMCPKDLSEAADVDYYVFGPDGGYLTGFRCGSDARCLAGRCQIPSHQLTFKESVAAKLRGQKQEMLDCYFSEREAGHHGVVIWHAFVALDGHVVSSVFEAKTAGTEKVVKCLTKIVDRWEWPKGGGTVDFPFDY